MKKVVMGICQRKGYSGEMEYLLVKTKTDYGMYFGHFQPAGGKQEADENDEQTLVREFNEELGVQVKPLKQVAEMAADVPGMFVSFWLCELPSVNFTLKEDEITEAIFMTQAEIEKAAVWPTTKKFFEQYIFNQENSEARFR
jgi:8-oxo-dGTP pyrophosphatase MutT (NUDIX family)